MTITFASNLSARDRESCVVWTRNQGSSSWTRHGPEDGLTFSTNTVTVPGSFAVGSVCKVTIGRLSSADITIERPPPSITECKTSVAGATISLSESLPSAQFYLGQDPSTLTPYTGSMSGVSWSGSVCSISWDAPILPMMRSAAYIKLSGGSMQTNVSEITHVSGGTITINSVTLQEAVTFASIVVAVDDVGESALDVPFDLYVSNDGVTFETFAFEGYGWYPCGDNLFESYTYGQNLYDALQRSSHVKIFSKGIMSPVYTK